VQEGYQIVLSTGSSFVHCVWHFY